MAETNQGAGAPGPDPGLDPENKKALLKAGVFLALAIGAIFLIKVLAGW